MDSDVDMLRFIKVCTLDYITANQNQDIRATSVRDHKYASKCGSGSEGQHN